MELNLTTDSVALHEREHAWSAWMRSIFFGLESDLYGAHAFSGHVKTMRAGEVVLTHLEASRHRVMRRQRIGLHRGGDYLKLVAPLRGLAIVEQFGRQVSVTPGRWAIYDTTRTYEVANPEYSRHLIVMFPRRQLMEANLPVEQLMGRQMGAVGISRVALDVMKSLSLELPHMSAVSAQDAGETILRLVRSSLLDLAGEHTGVSRQESFRVRVYRYINEQLGNPSLSIEHVAAALNCSKRLLHSAFSSEPETLAAYILRKRIEGCQADLKRPEMRQVSITEIAFSWGFNHSAHFSRAFREHLGVSPSHYRRIHSHQNDISISR